MEAGTRQRSVDHATGRRCRAGQNPISQDLALSAGMAERNSRVAISVAHRVSGHHHRHHYPDDLVHHAECATGRAGEPELDHEPGQGALVLSRPPGNAGVFRSLDCRRGDADPDHHWADGDSLYRYQPAGQWLLHVAAAQVCHTYVPLRLYCAVGLDDHHRYLHSRTGVAMVLAWTNLGPQPPHL